MKSLGALRLLLPALVVALLICLPYRLSDGATPDLTLGPLRVELGLVNVVLSTYIAGLTWLLARYSSTNLRGQHRLERFGALFAGMTVSLLVLVAAGNLLTLAAAWTASGVLLGFLVSHTDTERARAAARRVQRAMGLSSLLLWSGVIVAAVTGLALDGTDTAAALSSSSATVVAALLVGAGLVRSALAPFHRWLPETAEAPSPVSALLHAGIVNAAGVVAVLQWDLLSAQSGVLAALAIVGVATVVWCTLEQRVRPDVKGRLAASTSSQMGWMALQVGLGAPAAALLHLMGHGAWKAWLFLRAGGAVVRARRESSSPPLAWAHAWPALVITTGLALAPVTALAGLALLGWWGHVTFSAVHVLLVGVSLLVAVAVGAEAAALERGRAVIRCLVAASGGLVVAAYLVGALAWEQQLTARAELSHPTYAGAFELACAAVVAVALLGWLGVRVQPGSHHPVATLVSSTSLPPRSRRAIRPDRLTQGPASRKPDHASADPRPRTSPEPAGDEGSDGREVGVVRETIAMAGRMMGPAWPLRATVAVNPLSGLEILPFDTALSLAERFHQTPVRPSFSWFLDLYDQARISDRTLEQAMKHHGLGGGPRGVAGLVDLTRQIHDHAASGDEAELVPGGPDESTAADRALAHAHLWSARAWHRTEDRSADLHGPWQLWKRSAEHPVYRLLTRRRDADAFARSLPEDPAHAILHLLDLAHPHVDLVETVTAVLAAGPGWVAHAQWRARRSGDVGPLVELVALRLAHTVLHGGPLPATLTAGSSGVEDPTSFQVLQKVWLDALDRTTRDQLCRPLVERQSSCAAVAGQTEPAPLHTAGDDVASQSVWCIDVRSERIRRHVESTGNHETFGFAGFFGLSGRVTSPDGTSFDQCPVIVTPTVEIRLAHTSLRTLPAMVRAATRVAARPGLSFAVAEASGLAAFAAALTATLAPRTWRGILGRTVPGEGRSTPIELRDLADPDQLLTAGESADAAEAMLRTIGLVDHFAPVLVLAGHGSTTENNAFATAYDCGACGGNPGMLNARAMAQVLNDPDVRAELTHRGIRIPQTTRALAALHDTTTDRVTFFTTSPSDASVADQVEPAFAEAGRLTAAERKPALPTDRRTPTRRRVAGTSLSARAGDWSEPMPEWGLAGCAAIIVGPRHLTRGVNLSGRTFLHSYNRHHDPDGTVLTAILNAPVIVSQWIASQYWFSSVAPTTLGAGDKTTHNVLGDIGVLTGAHGDLRTGLPWQALFARDPGPRPDLRAEPQHTPSRHLVIIDAHPALLADAVRRSPTVLALLAHDWMRLVALDGGRIVDIADVLAAETEAPPSGPGRERHSAPQIVEANERPRG